VPRVGLAELDRPFEAVTDGDFGAGGVLEGAEVIDVVGELGAVGGGVVGEDGAAGAELGPEVVEVGAAGGFVGVDEGEVDGAGDRRKDLCGVAEVVGDSVGEAGFLEGLPGGVVLLLGDVDGVEAAAGVLEGGAPEEAGEAVAGADLDDESGVGGQGDVVEEVAFGAGDLPVVVAGFSQGVEFVDGGEDLRGEGHGRVLVRVFVGDNYFEAAAGVGMGAAAGVEAREGKEEDREADGDPPCGGGAHVGAVEVIEGGEVGAEGETEAAEEGEGDFQSSP